VLPHVLDGEVRLSFPLSEFDGSMALGDSLCVYLKIGIFVRECAEQHLRCRQVVLVQWFSHNVG
jgi:hypothetical protein